MTDLKERPIAIYIVCKNSEAYKKLEKLCAKYGNEMYIDWEQSQISYELEMKSREAELNHYGETFHKYKTNKGDN